MAPETMAGGPPDAETERWLRASFGLARRAAARGDEPYGALLVSVAGRLLAEAENAIVTTRDPTAHAETSLVRLLGGRFDGAILAGATLYASAEPCAMCAGAIYWSGIGRVVYGLGNARLYGEVLRTRAGVGLLVACREIFARAGRRVAVEGPLLEDEAAALVRDAFAAGRHRSD
jgi:tRNA(adenine34) deaminase